MFGYAAMLGPEAPDIVQHLVSEVGLGDPVAAREIRERLGLSETEFGDGIEELTRHDLVTVHGPYVEHSQIQPKGGAWLYVDADTFGYDLRADMLAFAESAVEREQAQPEEIEADTGLTPQRLNLAALALQHEGRVQLTVFTGRRAYRFTQARATADMRRYVRENRA